MRTVRSRVLLGVGAWLLGAASATVGSLYAVGQLGNSLLAVSTKQISVAVVNADLARENARHAEPLRDSTHSNNRSTDRRKKVAAKPAHVKASPSPSQSASPAPSPPPGILLTSPDGSTEATCMSGGAYLSYWSPQPGFEVDDVMRGPAAVASVSFRDVSGGIEIRVSCDSGVPVKRLVKLWRDE